MTDKQKLKDQIKKMKKGETLRFPTMPPCEILENSPMEKMMKMSKRTGIPIEKLRYNRDVFYFKSKEVRDEGWVDSVYINYTKL